MLALAAQAPATARLQALFDALHAEWQSGEPAPVAAWLARAIVWRLAEVARRDAVAPQRGGRQALYTRFVVLLEAHYLDHWPVTRYAERLGLNAERLNRMVRAETGQSVQALLHTRLLREACRRLLHVAAPVSRLAYELGFEDPAYFSRFFRRLTGLSPGAYRAQRQAGAGTGIAAATASMP
jgi:AraC family transcriptional activator of pobA